MKEYSADVVIAGGGLAGITTAYELLDQGKKVLLIEKGTQKDFGGLAKLSFGGVCMVGTPHQRRSKIPDSPDLAYRDWESFADWDDSPAWDLPKKWARFYVDNSMEYIYEYLTGKGVEFLPVVNWPEQGVHKPGNSVPRWHITWGTGNEIIVRSLAALEKHGRRAQLEIMFEHEVNDIVIEGGRAVAVAGKSMTDNAEFKARGEHIVIASGGICGGDLSYLKEHWFKDWGEPPKKLLNGAHDYGDGMLHRKVESLGGNLTHLDKQWHYAAGIHRPGQRRKDDGVSLVPARSALWMDANGRRFGPMPLMGYTDTRHVVETICKSPGQYSWQIMNWKIAIKELAASGSDYMTAFAQKKKLMLIKSVLFGNKDFVNRLIRENGDEDVIVAQSFGEMAEKMQERSLFGMQIDKAGMEQDIREYDDMIDRGPIYHQDEQLRRIAAFRHYKGDRIRTCKFQKIIDKKAMPLIAIREFILARKSLGGIQTDLQSRVLRPDGSPIDGLYAVGESAGFGGGGIHGHGCLEGTFLGSCVLTGRVAGKYIGTQG